MTGSCTVPSILEGPPLASCRLALAHCSHMLALSQTCGELLAPYDTGSCLPEAIRYMAYVRCTMLHREQLQSPLCLHSRFFKETWQLLYSSRECLPGRSPKAALRQACRVMISGGCLGQSVGMHASPHNKSAADNAPRMGPLVCLQAIWAIIKGWILSEKKVL